MKRIHKVKTAIIVKDTIPDEEVEVLRDHCNNHRDRSMIDFLISTGIRVGELVRLNIDDIYHNLICNDNVLTRDKRSAMI